MVYVGETRARKLRARLAAMNFGVVVQRGRVAKAALREWPRWMHDNLAFGDWRAGRPFDVEAFEADIQAIVDLPDDLRPEVVVLPDRVAGGLESLAMSIGWLARLWRLGLRFALVVQDGMREADIPWDAPWQVLFVGGSTGWKLRTMALWARAAHEHGRVCHVGRVGSAKRLRAAKMDGVDSIDSALPLFAERNLRPFLDELDRPCLVLGAA